MAELKVKRPTKRELYARALAESGKTMEGLEVVAFLFKNEAAQHGAHYALLLNGGVNYEIYDGWRSQAYVLAAPEEMEFIRSIMTEAGGKEFKPQIDV